MSLHFHKNGMMVREALDGTLAEKMLNAGVYALSDSELLSLIEGSKIEEVREGLAEKRGLKNYCSDDQNVFVQASLELGRRYLEAEVGALPIMTDPDKTKTYVKAWLCRYPNEVFACIFLDNRHHVLDSEIMFTGTIDGASVYPREVAKRCLELNAGAVIFAHNHPSGIAEPSQADRNITIKLTQALALLDVRVLDHLVVGDRVVTSMAERGMM